MANEPGSQEPQLADSNKPRGFYVSRLTAVAVLVGVAAVVGAVTYTIALSVASTACRRVPIPVKDAIQCLDSPPACSLPAWSTAGVCSIVVDPTCTCFQGQTRSCVPGDSGFPKQICQPGSPTCGVQFCALDGTEWKWESTCHAFP
jgi:hypothetical protein